MGCSFDFLEKHPIFHPLWHFSPHNDRDVEGGGGDNNYGDFDRGYADLTDEITQFLDTQVSLAPTPEHITVMIHNITAMILI